MSKKKQLPNNRTLYFWLTIATLPGVLFATIVGLTETKDDLTGVTGPKAGYGRASVAIVGSEDHESESDHPLDPVLELAKKALKRFNENVVDYTATLAARERYKGKLGPQSVMEIKVINGEASDDAKDNPPEKPLHAYVKFIGPKSKAGREIIYVAGRDDNNLIAHEAGFLNLMRAKISPTGILAMQGTKYPIYDLGFAKLLQKLIDKGESDRRVGLCSVQVFDHEEIGGRACQMIQVRHDTPKPEYEYHIAEIYIDKERLLPLKYVSYLWPESDGKSPPLEEEYIYTNVKLNASLTAEDFNPDNPNYDYPNG